MSDVQSLNLMGDGERKLTEDTIKRLTALQSELIDVLGKIEEIAPVQFLDWESEQVYNFLGLRINPEDGRVWVVISGVNDNLSAHTQNPLRDSRGDLMLLAELPMF